MRFDVSEKCGLTVKLTGGEAVRLNAGLDPVDGKGRNAPRKNYQNDSCPRLLHWGQRPKKLQIHATPAGEARPMASHPAENRLRR